MANSFPLALLMHLFFKLIFFKIYFDHAPPQLVSDTPHLFTHPTSQWSVCLSLSHTSPIILNLGTVLLHLASVTLKKLLTITFLWIIFRLWDTDDGEILITLLFCRPYPHLCNKSLLNTQGETTLGSSMYPSFLFFNPLAENCLDFMRLPLEYSLSLSLPLAFPLSLFLLSFPVMPLSCHIFSLYHLSRHIVFMFDSSLFSSFSLLCIICYFYFYFKFTHDNVHNYRV